MSNETTLVGNILAVNVNKTTPILLKEYMSDRAASLSEFNCL